MKQLRVFYCWLAAFCLLFLLLAPNSATAQSEDSAEPKVFQNINSYELFWPLSAGKTEGDQLYSLKLFKEKVRGWLIFGESNKADYAVFLGTKRVLEAEKLLKDGKVELAIKSLERADSNFSYAYETVKVAGSKGRLNVSEIRRDRLVNVKTLIDYLKTISPGEISPVLDAVKEKADVILRDYLP